MGLRQFQLCLFSSIQRKDFYAENVDLLETNEPQFRETAFKSSSSVVKITSLSHRNQGRFCWGYSLG